MERPQQLIELGAVLGGLGVTGAVGLLLVRRARAARLRQIEGLAPEPLPVRPARAEGKRRPVEQDRESDRESDQEPDRDDEKPGARPETSASEAARDRPREDASAPKPVSGRASPLVPGGATKLAPAASGVPTATPSAPAQVIPFPRRGTELDKPTLPSTTAPVPAPAGPAEPPAAGELGRPEPTAAPSKRRDTSALAPGLARTRSGWISRLGQLFVGKREIDPALLDEVEKVLLTADIGVRTSQKLLEEMRSSLSRKELSDVDSAWAFLRRRTTEMLSSEAPPLDWNRGRPFVLLIIGVNGSGKTTTIGKLASKLIADGKKVLVGAGDTFRAAAAEQLEIWAHRVGAELVRGKEGADPSSVLFDAVKRARTEGFDIVIADTAGRLHTKTDLMEELQKVRRVISKAAEGAPHETWLVVDATSGQNAIAQAQIFTQAMAVSGIVLTKLDGTAKGGVILGIADQVRIPVRFIGVGERVDDLREFDAGEFVEALYEQ
jgi:fused signal recognition particle receptor